MSIGFCFLHNSNALGVSTTSSTFEQDDSDYINATCVNVSYSLFCVTTMTFRCLVVVIWRSISITTRQYVTFNALHIIIIFPVSFVAIWPRRCVDDDSECIAAAATRCTVTAATTVIVIVVIVKRQLMYSLFERLRFVRMWPMMRTNGAAAVTVLPPPPAAVESNNGNAPTTRNHQRTSSCDRVSFIRAICDVCPVCLSVCVSCSSVVAATASTRLQPKSVAKDALFFAIRCVV